jgi:hypothetical protein
VERKRKAASCRKPVAGGAEGRSHVVVVSHHGGVEASPSMGGGGGWISRGACRASGGGWSRGALRAGVAWRVDSLVSGLQWIYPHTYFKLKSTENPKDTSIQGATSALYDTRRKPAAAKDQITIAGIFVFLIFLSFFICVHPYC